MRWAYGITTVPSRLNTTLPRTLKSLANAGFDKPRLFIDGTNDHIPYSQFGLEATYHYPQIKTFGNWCLALWELYIREPIAHRYAIFQDDMVTVPHLREYLERTKYPEKGYLNLFTFRDNELIIRDLKEPGFVESKWLNDEVNIRLGKARFQSGRGAVALVFDQEAVWALLQQHHFVTRPTDTTWGTRRVDGCVCTAMNKAGFKEYIHNPSLVQHIGELSSMMNGPQPKALSFPGEDFDAREFLDVRRFGEASTGDSGSDSGTSREMVGETLSVS